MRGLSARMTHGVGGDLRPAHQAIRVLFFERCCAGSARAAGRSDAPSQTVRSARAASRPMAGEAILPRALSLRALEETPAIE